MRYIIAELDRIAKYLEDMEEPWALNLAYRVDNCTQQLEDNYVKNATNTEKNKEKLASISKNVLDQYLEDMVYLSKKESSLQEMIEKHASENQNAEVVYKAMQKHFGKLGKEDSIKFIKRIIENTKSK